MHRTESVFEQEIRRTDLPKGMGDGCDIS